MAGFTELGPELLLVIVGAVIGYFFKLLLERRNSPRLRIERYWTPRFQPDRIVYVLVILIRNVGRKTILEPRVDAWFRGGIEELNIKERIAFTDKLNPSDHLRFELVEYDTKDRILKSPIIAKTIKVNNPEIVLDMYSFLLLATAKDMRRVSQEFKIGDFFRMGVLSDMKVPYPESLIYAEMIKPV